MKQDAKPRKKNKTTLIIVCVVLVLAATQLVVLGLKGGIGPLSFLKTNKVAKLAGNAEQYHPENVAADPDSPLAGKRLFFLGSSVTAGSGSLGVSMADYLQAVDGCVVTKDAIGGTTMADKGANSYVSRLNKHSSAESYDAVVIQLSINDPKQKVALGSVSDSKDRAEFDTSTAVGALEYMISFAREAWGCPVLVYTSPKFDNEGYQAMVDVLPALQEKWGIGLVDLWNNADVNAAMEAQRSLYMYDNVHPTQAGYLMWLPEFEAALVGALS